MFSNQSDTLYRREPVTACELIVGKPGIQNLQSVQLCGNQERQESQTKVLLTMNVENSFLLKSLSDISRQKINGYLQKIKVSYTMFFLTINRTAGRGIGRTSLFLFTTSTCSHLFLQFFNLDDYLVFWPVLSGQIKCRGGCIILNFASALPRQYLSQGPQDFILKASTFKNRQ